MKHEIRWVCIETGDIQTNPTALDLLEYANERLKDPEEFDCSLRSHKGDWFGHVRNLLDERARKPSFLDRLLSRIH